jgi:hypothetical protein
VQQAFFNERLSCDFGETFQRIQPNKLRLLTEGVGETALGQAAGEWHLATLEMRLAAAGAAVTRAGHASLVSLAGRLPLP